METMPVTAVLEHSKWFLRQLEELDYRRNDNLDLTILKLQGDRERGVRLLFKELQKGPPDLIVTNATMASQIALEMTKGKGIAQVFVTVSDPVGAGLIKTIGIPTGTNITGRIHMISRKARIELVMNLLADYATRPPIKAGFIHSDYPSAVGDIKALIKESQVRKDIEFISQSVKYRSMPAGKAQMLDDVKEAVSKLNDRVDFWWEPSGPLGELNEYTDVLLRNSPHPVIMGTKKASVKAGAILHVTPDPEATGREVAILADAILQGTDPGTLPVTPPSGFDIGVNITSALKHKIIIPPEILTLAKGQVFR